MPTHLGGNKQLLLLPYKAQEYLLLNPQPAGDAAAADLAVALFADSRCHAEFIRERIAMCFSRAVFPGPFESCCLLLLS